MKLFRIATIPFSLNMLLRGQLRFLNRHFEVSAISGAGTDMEEVAEREGVHVHRIEIQRQISPWKDFMSLFKLYLYFSKEKPHIVHSITPKAGLVSMLAAWMAGVPVRMHTFTGLIFPSKKGFFQTLLIWMDRLICSCATHIYPEGLGVKRDLQKYRITDKPLNIIANGNVNGVDLQYFAPEQISACERGQLMMELGINKSDFVFVFVGRLVRDKGITELVAAFSDIVASRSTSNGNTGLDNNEQPFDGRRVKLLLVGPREESDPLPSSTSHEIETHPDVIYVGLRSDVRPYLAVASAFVLPSYREGFPNGVLHAGAMELPSIVSDINGCNEIIINGMNGLIVPAKDVTALKLAMNELLSDSELYRSLQKSARPHVAQLYAQEQVWEATLNEYRKNLAAAGFPDLPARE